MNDTYHLSSRIDAFLTTELQKQKTHNTGQLLPAIEYTLLNGGKRMRPQLVYATAQSTGLDLQVADHIAAAIEMIHAYSLIHDDLPAMDDDDLRRGQPTCHIAYDEATAILAGDALQAMAFEILSQTPLAAEQVIGLLKILSQCAGAAGMVGGQMLDLEAENQAITVAQLKEIHAKKTGALLLACVSMVIECDKELSQEDRQHYLEFAKNFGMAYQIVDDVLDVTADTLTLGKPAQSDIKNHKSTYPSLLGLESARSKAKEHLQAAQQALSSLPHNTQLFSLTEKIENRKN